MTNYPKQKEMQEKDVDNLAFAHIQDGKFFTDAAAMARVELRTLMNLFFGNGMKGLYEEIATGI